MIDYNEIYATDHDFNENGICNNCGDVACAHRYSIFHRCDLCGAFDKITSGDCEHKDSYFEIETEPTCERYGRATLVCYDCFYSCSIMPEPTGHTFGDDGACISCGATERTHFYKVVEVKCNGDDCTDGWEAVEACMDCGETRITSGNGHDLLLHEHYFADVDELCCSSQTGIGVYKCACEKFGTLNMYSTCHNGEINESIEVLEDGREVSVYLDTCPHSGVEFRRESYTCEGDILCAVKEEITVTLSVNGELIRSASIVNHLFNHTYENGVCVNCGGSIEDCPHEFMEENYVFLDEYGFCVTYIVEESCPDCGYTGKYLAYCDCEWYISEEREDGTGIFRCDICGGEMHVTAVYGETVNCEQTIVYTYTFIKDGTVFYAFDAEELGENHSFDENGVCTSCGNVIDSAADSAADAAAAEAAADALNAELNAA